MQFFKLQNPTSDLESQFCKPFLPYLNFDIIVCTIEQKQEFMLARQVASMYLNAPFLYSLRSPTHLRFWYEVGMRGHFFSYLHTLTQFFFLVQSSQHIIFWSTAKQHDSILHFSYCQDTSSQEMSQTNPGNSTSVAVVSSAGPSIGTPHSPDSGMAISDGVSSSGSPATNNGQQFHHTQHCLGGPSSNSSGSSSTNHSSAANPGGTNNANCSAGNNGSDNSQQHQQQQQQQAQFASSGGNMVHGMAGHHGHLHNINANHQSSGNLNHHHHSHHQSLASSHANGIVNVTSTGRPTQARSPYEWMKKPTYSCSSSGSNPATTNCKWNINYFTQTYKLLFCQTKPNIFFLHVQLKKMKISLRLPCKHGA